jgi:hypothetical protein
MSADRSCKCLNLHKLIAWIRRLKLELDCYLQVVHIPGLVLAD